MAGLFLQFRPAQNKRDFLGLARGISIYMLTYILIVVLIILFLSSVRVVQQNTVYVIEFLGRFNRIMTAGLNLFFSQPGAIIWRHHREQFAHLCG
ncbi:MAG: hypothetical protein HYZ51_04880 [Candidatus Doudnabacteria bacterium]|nr:hypothetical protein [Candidatus Doudnabacteria bacterium]